MSRKKSLKVGNLLYSLALVLGIAALCMIFVPSVNINGALTGTTGYSGLRATFGYSVDSTSYFSFSILNFLSYLLLIIAIVLLVVRVAGPKKLRILDYIAVCLLLVSAVLFFLMPQLSVSEYVEAFGSAATLTLAVGAILSGVFAIVSALVVLVKVLLKK